MKNSMLFLVPGIFLFSFSLDYEIFLSKDSKDGLTNTIDSIPPRIHVSAFFRDDSTWKITGVDILNNKKANLHNSVAKYIKARVIITGTAKNINLFIYTHFETLVDEKNFSLGGKSEHDFLIPCTEVFIKVSAGKKLLYKGSLPFTCAF